MKTKGDPLPLAFFYKGIDIVKIRSELGEKFSSSLKKLPLNEWAGPVKSAFGYHLVYITEIKRPGIPEFSEIKNELQREYEYEREMQNQERIYKELLKNYSIEFRSESIDVGLSEQILKKLDSTS